MFFWNIETGIQGAGSNDPITVPQDPEANLGHPLEGVDGVHEGTPV